MTEETWRDIEDYEGCYQVSNMGRIKSLKRKISAKRNRNCDFEWVNQGRILKHDINKVNGSCRVTLCKNGKCRRFLVHTLVAKTFIPNPYNRTQVNHKNGDRGKNEETNLEWCTGSENMYHAYETGLQTPLFGERHQNCKLSDKDIQFIRDNYKPKDGTFGGKALAEKFNTNYRYMRRIINGEVRNPEKHKKKWGDRYE